MSSAVTSLTRWRPAVWLVWLAAVVVALFAVAAAALSWHRFLDLTVYRDALALWLSGDSLYDVRVTELSLPFTYPPSGAVALLSTTLLSLEVTQVLWLAASFMSVAVVVVWSFRDVPLARRYVALVAAVMLLSQPVVANMGFGQVNLFLMLLVSADWLRRDGRVTGVFTGLAAAVKLTPTIFFVLPLVQARWWAALRAAGTLIGVTGVVALFAWDETVTYFGSALWDTARVGEAQFYANQSLSGFFSRVGVESRAVWLAGVAAVLLLGGVALWRYRWGARAVPLLIVAVVGLLISPISWSHHWVWVCIAPAAAVALWRQRHRLEAAAAVLLIAAVSLFDPYNAFDVPTDWYSTSLWGRAVHTNWYVLAALLWLLVLVARPLRDRFLSFRSLGRGYEPAAGRACDAEVCAGQEDGEDEGRYPGQ